MGYVYSKSEEIRPGQDPRLGKKTEIREDISRYGGAILYSDEMRTAFSQRHHGVSTVGDHTLRVARTSLGICYALRRLHISTDIPAVVTGSLCHDLGILGRDEKYTSMSECSVRHPADSVKVAEKLMGRLPPKTTEIIARHMWPAGGSKPPDSLEAAIVSVADKVAAMGDVFIGCGQKGAELKGAVWEIFSRKNR